MAVTRPRTDNDDAREHYGDAVGSTLVISLYARARADEEFDLPEWDDEQAKRVWRQLDAEAAERGERLADLTMPDLMTMVGTVRRSQALDARVREFARAYPGAVVVTPGIGLCNRASRLADLDVEWVGLDRPDVIALRRRLLPDDPTRLLEGSVTDRDWLRGVDPDRPTILVAEGLLMYLRPPQVTQLLVRIGDHMTAPTRLTADVHHRLFAANKKVTEVSGARFHFGVWSGRALASLAPGWHLVSEDDTMAPIIASARRISTTFRRVTGSMMYGVYVIERD